MTDEQFRRDLDELATKVSELEIKVADLADKLENARLYGFSRTADED